MRQSKNRYILLILLLLVTRLTAAAIEHPGDKTPKTVADSLQHLFPFLQTDSNRICGNRESLLPLLSKLDRISKGEKEQAIIVHIGDSHVQPGIISAPLRKKLQDRYGNAGHGIIFPYRVVKSNGPDGYISRADTPWISCRIASVKEICPSGISGFTMWSDKLTPSFSIEFRSEELFGKGTNQLTVFHSNRDTCYRFSILNAADSMELPVSDSLSFSTTFLLATHPQKINISAQRQTESDKSATFYGMNLQGSEPGVVVHTIGVNGATFADYLQAGHFLEQLATLKPDLLILSLGTNEAVNAKTFTRDSLVSVLDSLISGIGKAGISAGIMFTTPPAIYKGSRKNRRTSYKPNPNAAMVRETIISYSNANQLPYWDWYQIMGGKTSMARWKSKKMTDKRYIHFSPKGYLIQGILLREAFLETITPPDTPHKSLNLKP
jgi:lysophospholipase L1-like esterase